MSRIYRRGHLWGGRQEALAARSPGRPRGRMSDSLHGVERSRSQAIILGYHVVWLGTTVEGRKGGESAVSHCYVFSY